MAVKAAVSGAPAAKIPAVQALVDEENEGGKLSASQKKRMRKKLRDQAKAGP